MEIWGGARLTRRACGDRYPHGRAWVGWEGDVDLICDVLPVDGVFLLRVLDHEGAACFRVKLVAARCVDGFTCGDVDVTTGVCFRVAEHRVGFLADQTVGEVSVEFWIDAKGEDVLVEGGEDSIVDDGFPEDFDAGVDGLGW